MSGDATEGFSDAKQVLKQDKILGLCVDDLGAHLRTCRLNVGYVVDPERGSQ